MSQLSVFLQRTITTLLCLTGAFVFFRWLLGPLLPFLLSGVLLYVYPQVLVGVGYSTADLAGLTGNGPLLLGPLAFLLLVKIVFSILSFASGVPGGLLMPILCLGALWGRTWAELGVAVFSPAGMLSPDIAQPWVLFGMVAYFAATVRAPLTGIALVTEMSGAYTCLPGSLLAGYVAAAVANGLRCPPIYDSLKARIRL